MNIAVLYIATGRYTVFWRDFYLSAEQFFLSDNKKDYYVFTDNNQIDFEKNPNVKKINQQKLGWPYDTMMRFDLFLGQEDSLKEYDYIFFFNANLLFVAPVGAEILPTADKGGIVTCKHPASYGKAIDRFAYERNPLSSSYIPFGSGHYYVQGALIGGTASAFLNLCRWCSNGIHKDMEHGIIPIWHDESILNKYILEKDSLILECNYLYPEGADIPQFKKQKKIIIRDKSDPKYGGHDYLRGISDNKGGKRIKRRRKFNFLGIKVSIKI